MPGGRFFSSTHSRSRHGGLSGQSSHFATSTTLRVATYNIHKGVRGMGLNKRLEIHNLGLGVEALDADLVFDVRFLKNPHYVPDLKPMTGRDRAVVAYIETDPDFKPFVERLEGMIGPLLPRFDAEGKSYLTIAVGCTGGRHRSVAVAERLADWLRGAGRSVTLSHRDAEAAGEAGGAA